MWQNKKKIKKIKNEETNERRKRKYEMKNGPLTFQSRYQGHLLTKGELKDMNDKTKL